MGAAGLVAGTRSHRWGDDSGEGAPLGGRRPGATTATVDFKHDDDSLSLRIDDDGGGAANDTSTGMGLSNMRQRAESLPQGRFEFESGAAGTRVSVSFAHPEARST